MTQKEKELLQNALSLFVQYDKKTIMVVINKLSSNEFFEYLEARDVFLEHNNKQSKRKKEVDSSQDTDYENLQLIKRILRVIKTAKLKPNDLEQVLLQIFPNKNFDYNSIEQLTEFLKYQPSNNIIELESALVKLYPSKDTSNSLDNWSSLIIKEPPDRSK